MVDAASENVLQQRQTVRHTLRQLGLSEADLHHRVIEVWNKSDCLNMTRTQPPSSHSRPNCAAAALNSAEHATTSSFKLTPGELWRAVSNRVRVVSARHSTRDLHGLSDGLEAVLWPKVGRPEQPSGSNGGSEQQDLQHTNSLPWVKHDLRAAPLLQSPLVTAESEVDSKPRRDVGLLMHAEDALQNACGEGGDMRRALGHRLAEVLTPVAGKIQSEQQWGLCGARPEECQVKEDAEQAIDDVVGGQECTRMPVVVSATTGVGLARLRHAIHERLALVKGPGVHASSAPQTQHDRWHITGG